MPTAESRLIQTLVADWFGATVGRVAGLLASRGPLTLPGIIALSSHQQKMSVRQIKDSLFVLLQHGFISWKTIGEGDVHTEYYFNAQRAILIIGGFGWMMRFVRNQVVDPELLMEVAVMGMVPRGEHHTRLMELGILEIASTLQMLAKDMELEPSVKRMRTGEPEFVRISLPGLLFLWRIELAVEYATRTANPAVGRIIRLLADGPQTASSVAIKVAEEKVSLPLEFGHDKPDNRSPAFHYLEFMAKRYSFVTRSTSMSPVDRASATYYRIDESLLRKELGLQFLLAGVLRRFGRGSVRIIKFLIEKGPLEDRFIGESLLMTAKEVRERCYQLLALGLLHLQEVPKTADHAPSRTIFLWTASLDRICPALLPKIYSFLAASVTQSSNHTKEDDNVIAAKRLGMFLEAVVFVHL